jgi:hypothetical protein
MTEISNNSELWYTSSVLREFTPIISNIIGYLVGIASVPIKYMDNVELETEYINDNLTVKKVYYWIYENPESGFVTRSDSDKIILFDSDNSNNFVPSHYLTILNFMLSLLSPELGSREGEAIYRKYLIGRRLFAYSNTDTTRHYYWYGDSNTILESNDSNELNEYLSDSSYYSD